MPELPEVHTVVEYLKPELCGHKIERLELVWKKSLESISSPDAGALIHNKVIIKVQRRAKWILIELKDHTKIGIHLRMTGQLIYCKKSELSNINPFHISSILYLDKKMILVFKDSRRFGKMRLFLNESDFIKFSNQLGIEPFDREFNATWLFQKLQSKNRNIKALLLDQSFIAGLGNIYVDEALWKSKIHPLKKSNTISNEQAQLLQKSIKGVLKQAIKNKGTSFQSFLFGKGKTGSNKSALKVFNQSGKPCSQCNTPIVKLKVSQRGTHICPQCQII